MLLLVEERFSVVLASLTVGRNDLGVKVGVGIGNADRKSVV